MKQAKLKNVEVKKDSADLYPGLWEGSVIQNAKLVNGEWHGLWTSPYGTYQITVPKARCRVWTGSQLDKLLKLAKKKGIITKIKK